LQAVARLCAFAGGRLGIGQAPSKNFRYVCNRTDFQAYFGDATAYAGHSGDSPEQWKEKR